MISIIGTVTPSTTTRSYFPSGGGEPAGTPTAAALEGAAALADAVAVLADAAGALADAAGGAAVSGGAALEAASACPSAPFFPHDAHAIQTRRASAARRRIMAGF
jgi:hypothetical protein